MMNSYLQLSTVMLQLLYGIGFCFFGRPFDGLFNTLHPLSYTQRLKHFHYYLWILAHGYFSESDSHSKEEPQPDADSAFSLPEANFPWALAVNRLRPPSKGVGWINFNDICQHIPLSLCVILMKIYSGVSHVTEFVYHMMYGD